MKTRLFKPTLAAVLACGMLLAGCQKKADTVAPAAPMAGAPATPASGAASAPP